MRSPLSSLAAAGFLAVAGLAVAANAPVNREQTRIPAEPLALALRTLASERGFQVIYDSEQVGDQKTRGASGELTVDEALTQVLRGTGLTFRRMSGSGIVIQAESPVAPALPRPHAAAAARPAPPSNGGPSEAAPGELGRVTIEASKQRQALRRRVDQFVDAVVVRPYDENPIRWDGPVCPEVAGLSRGFGEFFLWRISQAATDAGVQLAGRVCHPNLHVIATHVPDQLLRDWWARDWWMYSTPHGVAPVHDFVNSKLPIRVWYNTYPGCTGTGQARLGTAAAALTGFGLPGAAPPICANDASGSTHLSYPIVRSIVSAIVVIDLRQMKNVTLQQIADYVALVSLADVREDPDAPPAPSIL